MESAIVVEYIERQTIVCAVILEVKQQRLRLLNENDQEVNLSSGRLLHRSRQRLDLSVGRARLVTLLGEIAARRADLAAGIDIEALWSKCNELQEWVDLKTMTDFCFPENVGDDQRAAVIRAFFANRMHFKFDQQRFFPNSADLVAKKLAQKKEADRRAQLIQNAGQWLRAEKGAGDGDTPGPKARKEYLDILKSLYLFGKESPHHDLGRAIIDKAGMDPLDELFHALVRHGVFDPDENVDLHRLAVPTLFAPTVESHADRLIRQQTGLAALNGRRDLTDLPLMTIDGQATLDFDDAISIEELGDHLRIGIHIVDVGHFIKKGDPLDQAALARGSSIYMPDRRIPMLPHSLAEGLCSLRMGEERPAISTMIRIHPNADIIDFEVFASRIRVARQLTYFDVNQMADDQRDLLLLRGVADAFRRRRLADGAVQITLPEISVWIGPDGQIVVNRINRESAGRMLVSEIMIMANWLMGRFLADQAVPAIYRSQPDPKERLYRGESGTIYQNVMQRRLLNRFVLGPWPGRHSGLGLDAYVTATSPIRKYFDLVTQRQIRAALGLEDVYDEAALSRTIAQLAQPMSRVGMVQRSRVRYWLLKHLEGRVGEKLEAVVLNRRRNAYQILLPEFMLECDMPATSGIKLKPESLIQVTLQRVSARRDVLAVFM
ncbi:MAG: RNB domain-containing ribonuclease [Desulfobacterales bacterium]|nr:RNB domain-containing ribonuclease [Desulfobacterales bacterium]